MITKLRPNLYLGDKMAFSQEKELVELGITAVILVADDMPSFYDLKNSQIKYWKLGLRSDRMNPPHAKDLACHCPKYMIQNGETVLIQSTTGLQRGAYVACRVLCELEQRTIYEIMLELKQMLPEFDINKSYF